ncbi:MAG: repeat-containing protein [Planctomycetota bacterium]|nr:repeat-containing protein [Planctomycetota bacterium]
MTIDFTAAFGIGGNSALGPAAIAIDNTGNTYVTGAFSGQTSLDTSAGGVATGSTDVLVAKFSPSGQLLWSHHYGNSGIGSSQGRGIAVDAAGDVFVTGFYSGTLDFDPAHPGTHTVSTFERIDAFVLKLAPNGSFGASSYGVTTGGSKGAVNQGLAIAVDPSGTATVTGVFEQTAAFGGTNLTTTTNAQEPFVARLSPTGSFTWAKNFSISASTLGSRGNAVALDAAGDAFVAGVFRATVTFGPGVTATSVKDANNVSTSDAFVAKLDPSGNLVYGRAFGGAGEDNASGVAVDPPGNTYLIGRYSGTAAFGAVTISTASARGLFVATLTPSGVLASVHDLGVSGAVGAADLPSVAVDPSGNGYLTASFQGTGNVGGFAVASAGSDDILIAKVNLTGGVLDVRTAGGTGSDTPTGIAVNGSGTIAVYGTARPPVSFGSIPLVSSNPANLFIALAVQHPGSSGGDPSNPGSNGSRKFPPGDFDGDGKTDLAVFDPTTATYTIHYSSGIPDRIQQFGIANGKNQFVAGDFDGDGKTDECVFDPTTATYYIRYSGGGSRVQQFGVPNGRCMMVPGDFDGDGKTDECIFDPVEAKYYIRYSNPAFNGGSRVLQFGVPNGKNTMIPGDFDGDGKTDEAVFDPVEAKYYIRYSNPLFNGGSRVLQFGVPNAKNMMAPGDFDGDGKTDEAVYDPGAAKAYIRYSNPLFNGGSLITPFGKAASNNVLVPALLGVTSTSLTLRSIDTESDTDFTPLLMQQKHRVRDAAIHLFGHPG